MVQLVNQTLLLCVFRFVILGIIFFILGIVLVIFVVIVLVITLITFLIIISLPILGEILYQPRLNSKTGLTRRLFYRPPDILEELLPEINRLKELLGARMAVLRSIRSSITLRGLRQREYIIQRLKDSKVPLITVWGAEEVRRELPGSIVHVVPECDHWPQMEKPDLSNLMLTDSLKGGPAQAAQHAC